MEEITVVETTRIYPASQMPVSKPNRMCKWCGHQVFIFTSALLAGLLGTAMINFAYSGDADRKGYHQALFGCLLSLAASTIVAEVWSIAKACMPFKKSNE